MNVSEIMGRPVMDLSTATTIGRVGDVVIDAETRHVVAFRLAKSTSTRTWLPFENLSALGVDTLTVADESTLIEDPVGAPAGIVAMKALGGRLLTEQGREVGPLQDIELDEGGAVTGLTAPSGTIRTAADLLGIGSYACVVADSDRA